MDASPPHPSRRQALLCALLVGGALLATCPISHQGYLDDFSYAKSALDFARTGRFVYNGWATAMLGWQVPWGALFLKLFGFSFTVLRLSLLPFAVASVYLFHRILVRLGATRRNASFGALTLGLSPLYVPIAVSFMTDIPGLFVLLLCLLLCLRAVAAPTDRATVHWLLCAALVSLAGGTVRQTSWLGALVLVPSTAWMLRRRRRVLPAATLAAALSLLVVLALMHWYSRQPNVMPEPSLRPDQLRQYFSIPQMLRTLAKVFLYLGFLMLPLLLAWLHTVRRLPRAALVRIAILFSLVAARLTLRLHHGHDRDWIMPWLPMSLERHPIAVIDQIFGSSVALPETLRLALTLLVVAAALHLLEQLAHTWRTRPRAAPAIRPRPHPALWLLGPFTAAYLLLTLPRAGMGVLYDRYVLGLMPAAIVLLVLLYQRCVASRLPAIAPFTLILFAVYAIAGTHDFYAAQRANDAALDRLLRAGVPRASISQSFSSDGWFQVSTAGRMHVPGSSSLNGAASLDRLHRPIPACSVLLERLTPAIDPRVYIVSSPSSCLAPTSIPPLPYTTWLPPIHRQESIQQPQPDPPQPAH